MFLRGVLWLGGCCFEYFPRRLVREARGKLQPTLGISNLQMPADNALFGSFSTGVSRIQQGTTNTWLESYTRPQSRRIFSNTMLGALRQQSMRHLLQDNWQAIGIKKSCGSWKRGILRQKNHSLPKISVRRYLESP